MVFGLSALMYHHVGLAAPGVGRPLTVSPARFRRQMEWLDRQGYEGVGLGGLVDHLEGRRRSRKRPVLITFDDGFQDLAGHAYPLLEELGFGAVTFVVTGLAGATNEWDRQLAGDGHRLLSREEIAEWKGRGMDFGAHGRTHVDLRGLDESSLEGEVLGSGDDLERMTGEAVTAFAYPFGSIDDRVVAMTRRRYAVAFTTHEGRNSRRTDRMALRRTMVQEHDATVGFASRVVLGWSPFARLRTCLATLRRQLLPPGNR